MRSFFVIIFMVCGLYAAAQKPGISRIKDRIGTVSSGVIGGSSSSSDSSLGFEHRDPHMDSITISYHLLDSVRRYPIDSGIADFGRYYSIPAHWNSMGNNGAAAYPLIFQYDLKAGFDAGFHAFDLYRFSVQNTRLYTTTKPFTTLGYMIAKGREQMLQAQHTQNPRRRINWGLDYRSINSPGLIVNQNANHHNIRLYENFEAKRKRYGNTVIILSNLMRASENGGILNDSALKDKNRFTIPTRIGKQNTGLQNPFNTTVYTGHIEKDFTLYARQKYDFGVEDSVEVNDSTMEYLFFPKLRLQHTFTYQTQEYLYQDYFTDSAYYKQNYGLDLQPADTIIFRDKWKIFRNDFAIYQFPDNLNPAQYITAGVRIENLQLDHDSVKLNMYNLALHGEYKNRTKNKAWDIFLAGEYFLTGINHGDYSINANLSRTISRRFGNARLFFNNVNRTPSFIFDPGSAFAFGNNSNFKKENIIHFGGSLDNRYFQLGVANYFISNLSYFTDYYHRAQTASPVNITQITGNTKLALHKHWDLYIDAAVQQAGANNPYKVPLLYLRNRLAYEGRFFKNLNLSTGLEVRYFTPYKMNNYSPVMGAFMPQDSVTIKNLPDINAYLNFRIKSFTGYLRAENLNTIEPSNGFRFTNNNYAAAHYPLQGYGIRLGIRWWFVN